MTLVKRDYRLGDPFGEMDHLFNRSFLGSDFWRDYFSFADSEGAGRRFPVNIYGDDETYYLVAELPGIKREDIELKLENAVLSISAKRTTGEGDDAREYAMTRSVTVGDDVNPDAVTAKLEDGVLTVTLPKAEERKPKAISIG